LTDKGGVGCGPLRRWRRQRTPPAMTCRRRRRYHRGRRRRRREHRNRVALGAIRSVPPDGHGSLNECGSLSTAWAVVCNPPRSSSAMHLPSWRRGMRTDKMAPAGERARQTWCSSASASRPLRNTVRAGSSAAAASPAKKDRGCAAAVFWPALPTTCLRRDPADRSRRMCRDRTMN
jgi:hypothetical protein